LPKLFGRKKQPAAKAEPARKLTDLEQLCGQDKETYEALMPVMILDPRKIDTSAKQAAENAKKGEKEDDSASAGMWYVIAGGLAIYEGNVKKVVEYFTEAQRITGKTYAILKNPETAVAKAQEYYKTFLTE